MRFLFRACQLTPRSAAGSAMNASKHHGQVPHGRPVAIRHRHVELIEGTRTASCSIAIADTLIAIPQRTSQFPQRARSPASPIFQFDPLEEVPAQVPPPRGTRDWLGNVPPVLPCIIRCLDDRAPSLEAADHQCFRCTLGTSNSRSLRHDSRKLALPETPTHKGLIRRGWTIPQQCWQSSCASPVGLIRLKPTHFLLNIGHRRRAHRRSSPSEVQRTKQPRQAQARSPRREARSPTVIGRQSVSRSVKQPDVDCLSL